MLITRTGHRVTCLSHVLGIGSHAYHKYWAQGHMLITSRVNCLSHVLGTGSIAYHTYWA